MAISSKVTCSIPDIEVELSSYIRHKPIARESKAMST